jgi:hypothetical protein
MHGKHTIPLLLSGSVTLRTDATATHEVNRTCNADHLWRKKTSLVSLEVIEGTCFLRSISSLPGTLER